MSFVDVLIIGAGPAGLMAATGLANAGVKVRIIDKRSHKIPAGQADGISPLSNEILKSYGFGERLWREGNQMHLVAFYNPTAEGGIERTMRSSAVNCPTARFPFMITLGQSKIESIFLDTMKASGLEVDREIRPSSIELSAEDSEIESFESHPVTVAVQGSEDTDSFEDSSKTEIVHAKYVLGADGAHSWTRKEIGIEMEGAQTEYVWGVIDGVPIDTDFPDIRNRCAIHSPIGSVMVIPREGDLVRLYLQLPDDDAKEVLDSRGRLDKSKWNAERLVGIAQRAFHPFKLKFAEPIQWWTLYIINQRVASAFSLDERIFIAGDACHTHSPKAGQGMNASMSDAHNLSWKMAYVVRGWADRKLLKSYEFERRKYAQDLIAFDKKFAALFSEKAAYKGHENGVTHEEFWRTWKGYGGLMAGVGICYEPSVATKIPEPEKTASAANLTIGMRVTPQIVLRAADSRAFELLDLLPADMRFKIVVFAGDIGTGVDNFADMSDEVREQRARVHKFSREVCGDNGVLMKFVAGRDGARFVKKSDGPSMGSERSWSGAFDVMAVFAEKKETVNIFHVPKEMGYHWSKIYLDDVDIPGKIGGSAYAGYGIGSEGCAVVVRPDGYIGTIVRLDDVQGLEDYLGGFMVRNVEKVPVSNGIIKRVGAFGPRPM